MKNILAKLPTELKESAEKLFTTSSFEEAVEIYQNDIDSHEGPFAAAYICLKQKSYQLAVELFLMALQKTPMLVFGHANLAVAYFRLGQIKSALIRMNRAIKHLIHVEMVQLEQNGHPAPTINDTSIPATGELVEGGGRILGGKVGIGDGAIALLNPAIDIKSEEREDYEKIIMPEALYHFGNYSRKKGNFDVAITCFRLATMLSPENAIVQTNLGTALASRGEIDEAYKELIKAIVLDPEDAIAHYSLGCIYCQIGEFSYGAQHTLQALSIRSAYYPLAQNVLDAILEENPNGIPDPDKNDLYVCLYFCEADTKFIKTLAEKLAENGVRIWIEKEKAGSISEKSLCDIANRSMVNKRIFIPCLTESLIDNQGVIDQLLNLVNNNADSVLPVTNCQLSLKDKAASIPLFIFTGDDEPFQPLLEAIRKS